MRLWIKNPLAILASDAEGGIVVQVSRIIELVPAGKTPIHDWVFDASRHVVIPGLINTHHHFYQTLTRAHPKAINKELFPCCRRSIQSGQNCTLKPSASPPASRSPS